MDLGDATVELAPHHFVRPCLSHQLARPGGPTHARSPEPTRSGSSGPCWSPRPPLVPLRIGQCTTHGIAIVEQQARRHRPAVVDFADHILDRYGDIVEEFLTELIGGRSSILICWMSIPGWWILRMNMVRPRCLGACQSVRARHMA